MLCQKGFNPKLPFCIQKEEKKSAESKTNKQALTQEQANESRRVTKCRFIIEKKIGEMKKFKALDNRRNTEVGHLQIDYRIACSMINYTHEPCLADKNYVNEISNGLLNKMKPFKNDLSELMNLTPKIRIGTVAIPAVELANIADFPKLSKKKMMTQLFFGSYYLKLCRSYLADLLKNNLVAQINKDVLEHLNLATTVKSNLIRETNRSKIICVEIPSRHHRGLKAASLTTTFATEDAKTTTTVVETQKLTKRESVLTSGKTKHSKYQKQKAYVKKFRDFYSVFVQYVPHKNSSKSIICELTLL